jgi:sn-glycerol 3-phosphate transport system substrate-binding protein
MFREAGLDPEAPPTTWDELVEMGKALTTDDYWGLMIPSTGYPYWMFQALAIQNGKEVMSNDGLTTYFDDPTVVETLEFWRRCRPSMASCPRAPWSGALCARPSSRVRRR